MNFPENYYLNFHAHQQLPAEGEIVIQSLFLQNDLIAPVSNKIFFTAGLHPWHADRLSLWEISNRLTQLVQSKQIIAIGESGLDKLKGPQNGTQIEVFKLHARLAEELSVPLIVHSVKTHNEIFKIRKELNFKSPWVIHHFNGSKKMAFDFIDQGMYLSLCHHLKSKTAKISNYLGELPLSKIFLETDDFKIDIQNLYNIAALKFEVSLDKLKQQLMLNLKELLNE